MKIAAGKFFLWIIYVYFVFFRIEKLNIDNFQFGGQFMKIWGRYFILLTMLILLSATGSTLAQDAGMSDVETLEERDVSETEKTVYTPGEEVRYIPKASGVSSAKDSLSLQIHDFPMQRASQKPDKSGEKQSAKPKDDSILTFNFLYYIIQKYKLQDIID